MNNLNYTQLISMILHNSLYESKQKNSEKKTNIVADTDKKGAVAVVLDKEDLKNVHGLVVTSKEAVNKFAEDCYEYWTPNAYNYLTYNDHRRTMLTKHEDTNLQQINAFVVDIDSKNNDLNMILTCCSEQTVGIPTAVIETNKGYQLYFVLEEPMFISNKNNYRSLVVAKKISENIRKTVEKGELDRQIQLEAVDHTCNHFGFFRMPNKKNLVFFNENILYNAAELITWSQSLAEDMEFPLYGRTVKLHTRRYERLLPLMLEYKATHGQRNNCLFTIALALYDAGVSKVDALAICKKTNMNYEPALSTKSVQKIVGSAYKGIYNAPKNEYIRSLFEVEEGSFFRGIVYTKNAKAREDRTYSHFHEWEHDVITWLKNNENLTNEDGFIAMTQKELCMALNIPRATLHKVLKRSKAIITCVVGQGRGSITLLAYTEQVVKARIHKKKARVQVQNEMLQMILNHKEQRRECNLLANMPILVSVQLENKKIRC